MNWVPQSCIKGQHRLWSGEGDSRVILSIPLPTFSRSYRILPFYDIIGDLLEYPTWATLCAHINLGVYQEFCTRRGCTMPFGSKIWKRDMLFECSTGMPVWVLKSWSEIKYLIIFICDLHEDQKCPLWKEKNDNPSTL